MIKIDFRETLYKKIDFGLLKKVASFHKEDASIISNLNELCSSLFRGRSSNEIFGFSEFLQAVSKSSNEYKEPEITEEKITEKDLIKALKGIGVKDSERVVRDCTEVVEGNKEGIEENYLQNKEEVVIVASYTYEDEVNEASPYKIINKKLWNNDIQDQLTSKKSYLRLLLRALRKLPRTKPQTLYRGIKYDKHEYKIGEEIVWKGFSSTSTSMRATQTFLKTEGKVEGTLFEIRNACGYDIRGLSDYTDEEGTKQRRKHLKIICSLPLIKKFLGAYDEVQGQRGHTAR